MFNPEHIGVLVNRTDIVLPDYLFYALMHVHQQGYWERFATGTLNLVNIRVSDVQRIEMSPR
ncbi:Orf9 [Pseudomonas coronafaciens pv. atropurpurea]|nr:Orf9 [Pseudomonas coronafaciens pv. atropurpurea]